MRRFRRCGGVSKGCFLAPAAYLFCAYISIYCTFADRWSYRSVSVEATNSFYHSSKNFGNESSWELLHNLTVDTTVTGVVGKMNQTKIFHTVLIHTNDQSTSKFLYKFERMIPFIIRNQTRRTYKNYDNTTYVQMKGLT